MIDLLITVAAMWFVGRRITRRRRRDHRPRLLALVERSEPGGIDLALRRIEARDERAPRVYQTGWARVVPMPVAGPGRNRSG